MMICTKLVSFPTRERGLKPGSPPCHAVEYASFPTRERGLKQVEYDWDECAISRSLRGNVD